MKTLRKPVWFVVFRKVERKQRLKKNPLKVMVRLNPYATVLKRAAILAKERKEHRAKFVAAKRGVVRNLVVFRNFSKILFCSSDEQCYFVRVSTETLSMTKNLKSWARTFLDRRPYDHWILSYGHVIRFVVFFRSQQRRRARRKQQHRLKERHRPRLLNRVEYEGFL